MTTILLCDGPPEAADFFARFADEYGYELRVSRRFFRKNADRLEWGDVDHSWRKPLMGPERWLPKDAPVELDPFLVAVREWFPTGPRRELRFWIDSLRGTLKR